ncbi:MAG TPA: hypothetical protein VKG82_04005 [Solirubrobacteraceae bacterium]|nr:hypothetical protein [Solirubrobacteraceae bacterium]
MSARAAVLLLTMLLAAGWRAPGALAASSDASSTQTYLQANFRLVNTAGSRIPSGESILQGVLAQVRRECPHAAMGSPQDPESTQLSNEVIGTMVTAAIHPDLGSIREYLRSAAHLRWSSSGLTSAVAGYVSKLKTMASLSEPKLCADVRSWAASGFKTLPPSTVAFDDRFVPDWVALGELPSSLSRFEQSSERSLAGRSAARETELTDFEAREVETWGKIMDALELNP